MASPLASVNGRAWTFKHANKTITAGAESFKAKHILQMPFTGPVYELCNQTWGLPPKVRHFSTWLDVGNCALSLNLPASPGSPAFAAHSSTPISPSCCCLTLRIHALHRGYEGPRSTGNSRSFIAPFPSLPQKAVTRNAECKSWRLLTYLDISNLHSGSQAFPAMSLLQD